MPRNLPSDPRRRIDILDWIIAVVGVGVLIVTILWFANVLTSQITFRLAVAGYCFLIGILFLLKRFLPALSTRYTSKSLLFYLIAGLSALLAGGLVIILTLTVG